MSKPLPDIVSFENKFFSASNGVIFFKNEISGEPIMQIPIDKTAAELPFDGIRKELKLEDDDHDAHMLEVVEKSLNFIQALRIGDALPSEIHSGQASWDISDKHRATARSRLSLQLISWLSGDEEVIFDATQLEMLADDPAMKTKISEAFASAAEKLGIPPDQKDEVVDLVDGLGDELAYIEALRDQFEYISVVEARIERLAEIYKSEQAVIEVVKQVQKLCHIPMRQFRHKFEELDAQTGEIIAVLKNMAAQVKFIRESRDELYQRFWAWKDISEQWHRQPAKRSRQCEALVQETYRFLAQRFLPQNEWELFTKSQENTASNATETLWS